MEQRSDAWFQARAGRITGSRIARAMASKASDGYQRLINELAHERQTGRSTDRGFTSAAMQWGIDHEDRARTWYSRQHRRQVQQIGFVTHPTYDFVGVSPDGLVEEEGLIEIKCPQWNNFAKVADSQRLPPQYRWQVQSQLWVCRRQWVDFVCFYPPGDGVVLRVLPNPADFDRIETRCIEIDREVTRRCGIGSAQVKRVAVAPATPGTVQSSPRHPPSFLESAFDAVGGFVAGLLSALPWWVWVVIALFVVSWLDQ